MKNKKILAIMLVFGIMVISCDTGAGNNEPYDGPKTIKITGFNLQGKTDLYVELFDKTTGIGSSKITIASAHASSPSDQTITLELLKNDLAWIGTGKYFITISVNPDRNSIPGSGTEYFYSTDGKNPALVDISNEVTILEWSKFIWLRDYMAG